MLFNSVLINGSNRASNRDCAGEPQRPFSYIYFRLQQRQGSNTPALVTASATALEHQLFSTSLLTVAATPTLASSNGRGDHALVQVAVPKSGSTAAVKVILVRQLQQHQLFRSCTSSSISATSSDMRFGSLAALRLVAPCHTPGFPFLFRFRTC